jgi:hypothetical protein
LESRGQLPIPSTEECDQLWRALEQEQTLLDDAQRLHQKLATILGSLTTHRDIDRSAFQLDDMRLALPSVRFSASQKTVNEDLHAKKPALMTPAAVSRIRHGISSRLRDVQPTPLRTNRIPFVPPSSVKQSATRPLLNHNRATVSAATPRPLTAQKPATSAAAQESDATHSPSFLRLKDKLEQIKQQRTAQSAPTLQSCSHSVAENDAANARDVLCDKIADFILDSDVNGKENRQGIQDPIAALGIAVRPYKFY